MTTIPQGDAAAGDPTRKLLDAVRAGGPRALAELLGDQVFLLLELATRPGALFGEGGTRSSGSTHDSAHFSAVIGRLHEQRSALEALEARAVVGLADSMRREARADELARVAQEQGAARPRSEIDERAERAASREYSMITRRTPAGAGRSLASCRRLVESMPVLFDALATGQAAAENVRGTAVSVAPLSPQQREEVDRRLASRLPALDGAGPKRWKREIARLIEATDPTGEERRHQHARTRRHVTVRPGEHGMATVSARIPALDAAKIRKRLSLEAERLRAQGDRRGHQAIQADIFLDTLLGREGGTDRTRLDIGVIITDRALLTPNRGDIAQIEGYGPVPASAIRHEFRGVLSLRKQEMDTALGTDGPAARAALRRLYTHPTTGELVAMESVGRAFPPALARFILWRDVTCRGPFCDAPIRQTDHITPHASGGRTCSDNGEGTCAFCNDKENQVRSVERDADPDEPGHRVTWTSRNGVLRTTVADPLGPISETAAPEQHADPEVTAARRSETHPAQGDRSPSRDRPTRDPGATRDDPDPSTPSYPTSPPEPPRAPDGSPRRGRRGRAVRRQRGSTGRSRAVRKHLPRHRSRGRGPTPKDGREPG